MILRPTFVGALLKYQNAHRGVGRYRSSYLAVALAVGYMRRAPHLRCCCPVVPHAPITGFPVCVGRTSMTNVLNCYGSR